MFSIEINAKETTISVESFANGIYFLEMVSDNKKSVRKIIVEKQILFSALFCNTHLTV